MSDVTMPQLGESVTEGTITRWFKQPGDEVAEDEILLEVSTDKVDTEVPSPVAGTLQELRAEEGDTVDVGTVIAVVGQGAVPEGDSADADQADDGEASETADVADEAIPPQPAEAEEAQAPAETAAEQPSSAHEAQAPPERQTDTQPRRASGEETDRQSDDPGAASAGGALLSPLVRRLLSDADVDAADVKGTGHISVAIADAALKMLDVDPRGFDVMDRKLLEAVIHRFDGGPVGLDNIAASIGEEAGTIEDVIEPYLIQQGFLQRTPRGRIATLAAFRHLGVTPPQSAGGLFDA